MTLGMIEETATIKLAVVGCDYITSLGLAHILKDAPYLEVVGTAADRDDGVELIASESIDIVLVDAGITVMELELACADFLAVPNPPAVVVMGDIPPESAALLADSGVTAILHHGLVAEDLPVALRMISRGGALILNECARRAAKDRGAADGKMHLARVRGLNKREQKIALGIVDGLTNAQLASSMHVSEATVKILVSNVMNKLGASNRVQVAVSVTRAQMS